MDTTTNADRKDRSYQFSSRQLNLPRLAQPAAANTAALTSGYGSYGGHGGHGGCCGHGYGHCGCGGGFGGLFGGGKGGGLDLGQLGLLAAGGTLFYLLYSAITALMNKRRRRRSLDEQNLAGEVLLSLIHQGRTRLVHIICIQLYSHKKHILDSAQTWFIYI